MCRISIVIPVFNESRCLKSCVDKVNATMVPLSLSYEVILVDDGSFDGSWELIQALSKENERLRAVRFTKIFGKEAAITAGLETSEGDAAVIMDADLQYPVELIPKMIRIWEEHQCFIVEAIKEKRQKESLGHRMGAFLFYKIYQGVCRLNLENASDFKLLDREVIRQYLELPEYNRFFRGLTAWFGYKTQRVYFTPANRGREAGGSRWSPRKLMIYAKNNIISFTSAPLRLITVLGVLFLLVAAILGIQTLVHKLTGQAVEGFTTVILIQLCIGSVIMISLGIIGEYLARIFEEIKARPMYIVSEKLNQNSVSLLEK